jgi:hypothetical protein
MLLQSLKYMVDNLNPIAQAAPLFQDEERRSSLRVELPFPALVRGIDANNQAFEEETVLDNLSAAGLSLPLTRLVQPGTRLFLVIRLSTEPADTAPGPRIAVRGVAYRVEQRSTKTYSLAIMFKQYRFLYSQAEC